MIIEDFFNGDSAFDMLVDHAPTMNYIRAIVPERPTINNSEIRIRYPGNQTHSHLGGPVASKYRYSYTGQGISCMMVRMIYFVHDVGRRARRILRRAGHAQEQHGVALRRQRSRIKSRA